MPKNSTINRIIILTALLLLIFVFPASGRADGVVDSRFLNITRIIDTSDGVKYAAAINDGFLVSFDGGKSWRKRNTGLPRKIVYPFSDEEVETLTSIGFDPKNETRLICTTAFGLFISENSGNNWKSVSIGEPVSGSNYLTGAALSPHDDDTYLIATSFSGIFETINAGESWTEIAEKSIIYRGAGFNEEIAGAVYSPFEPGVIYLAYSFGNGLYRSNSDRSRFSRIDGGPDGGSIRTIQFSGTELDVYFTAGVSSYRPGSESWSAFSRGAENKLPGAARAARLNTAADRKGLYIGPSHANGERLNSHFDFMERNGLDSLVIDIKDDYGYLTYDSDLEIPEKIGAVKPRIDLPALIEQAHERGFYIIGRIVIFKDQQLFNYNNNEYALWDKYDDAPWRYRLKNVDDATGDVSWEQREYWVDPFNEHVWQYNADIADELQRLGVDEIQFDYIRFPSDGDTSRIKFRSRRAGMSRINALESFFRLVRESVHVPISTDLYGFNSYYRMGNWIGQNIEMLAEYIDVICPMYYPSHFPRNFMKEVPYIERAEKIYYEGTLRAREIVAGRSLIRPYVQAFLLPSEYYMEEPEYQEYLLRQLKGCRDADSSGWLLWNMSNRYYMVPEPLGGR
ncbi:MAG: hypothetical protein JEZ04_03310 [Spirochaetales bacterium]|nr:hypothetical protein [Spirochaetales bacterium]